LVGLGLLGLWLVALGLWFRPSELRTFKIVDHNLPATGSNLMKGRRNITPFRPTFMPFIVNNIDHSKRQRLVAIYVYICATREAACGRVRRKFLDVQIQSSDVVQTGVFGRSSPTETQTPGSSTGCRQHRNRSVCFMSRRQRSTISFICSVCVNIRIDKIR